MDTLEILKILKHRYPFLMVDRVVSASENEITTRKNITFNEPQFMGHFPENPIFPGVLIVEFMAQSCGLLERYANTEQAKEIPGYLIGLNKVKFYKLAYPGDVLLCRATLKNAVMQYKTFGCVVTNQDDGKVATGEITLFLKRNSGA